MIKMSFWWKTFFYFAIYVKPCNLVDINVLTYWNYQGKIREFVSPIKSSSITAKAFLRPERPVLGMQYHLPEVPRQQEISIGQLQFLLLVLG